MRLSKNKGLNTFQIKMLAVLFMVLDHIYLYFFSPSMGPSLILTCIGRSACPLFLFCMVAIITRETEKSICYGSILAACL